MRRSISTDRYIYTNQIPPLHSTHSLTVFVCLFVCMYVCIKPEKNKGELIEILRLLHILITNNYLLHI